MDKWPPRKKGEKKVKRGEEKGTEEEWKIGKFQVLGMLWWGWVQQFSEGEQQPPTLPSVKEEKNEKARETFADRKVRNLGREDQTAAVS